MTHCIYIRLITQSQREYGEIFHKLKVSEIFLPYLTAEKCNNYSAQHMSQLTSLMSVYSHHINMSVGS